MFFATWLSEVSDLKSELVSGNAYTAAARREGLPQLVAVDETVVEPSAQTVRSYLRNLGTSLNYPVALDTTGRVADGYGVQDQPWFALVSASGKIIWSHDGWLPLPPSNQPPSARPPPRDSGRTRISTRASRVTPILGDIRQGHIQMGRESAAPPEARGLGCLCGGPLHPI